MRKNSASRYGVDRIKLDHATSGDTFDAVGLKRMPIHEASYDAGFMGNRRQMPPMQKYGV